MKTEVPVMKNKSYEITISALGSEGQGIGRIQEFTVFVEGALLGEVVRALMIKVKKNYAVGKLIEIIKPSLERVEPPCPVAKYCGGCQLMHLSYEGQLAFKENKVRENLRRIGKLEEVSVLPIIGMDTPYHYRNKAQYPVGGQNGKLELGFYAKRSHRIVDTNNCLLQHESTARITQIVREFMEEFHILPYDEATHSGLVRHVLTRVGFNTGEIMVCLVLCGNKLPKQEELVKRLSTLSGMVSILINENRHKTNVILGDKVQVLFGRDYITDIIGDIRFQISSLSFFQVNPVQTKILYDKALEMADLKGTETVLDLYCGIGSISLYFAKYAEKVLGVEIVPEAIADAKRNAELNGIENASFLEGAAEDIVPRLYKEKELTADVVVIDPPRKGCDQGLLDVLIAMQPKKLIYMSCDSATLARDLRILCDNGFEVSQVQPVDQFCMTEHVEVVVSICGKNQ